MREYQFDLWTDLFLLKGSARFDFEDDAYVGNFGAWTEGHTEFQKNLLSDSVKDEELRDVSTSGCVGSLTSNMDSFCSISSDGEELPLSLKGYSINSPFVGQGSSNYSIPYGSKFFVIKSFNERNVILALQHNVWSSTKKGNRRLESEYQTLLPGARLFLLFSINKSGKFCAVAEMCSALMENDPLADIWETHTDAYRFPNLFRVKWWFVKDVQVRQLNHLIWEAQGERKTLGHSRDTEWVPFDIGTELIFIFNRSPSRSSLMS
ncbi:unnamed protein product [Kluyveromyces dobzhanskii CBS 2104]|uniref:WGS project CCBQ000000000 data, contig 00106 n=1 Tax=Kluyveromyces dobzhanskii CBS 2104 TaxID=1427455 RepID=A0A0A8L583_9SACH|nr:unnamed protein product [Kluyveromyces dobzhanskii CBS 2104]